MTNEPPSKTPSQTALGGAIEQASAQPSLWARLTAFLGFRNNSIRENLTEALLEDTGARESNFSDSERALLQNVLKLREMRVDDVMVPRADIEAVEIGETMGELVLHFRTAEHSRLPVYEENLDRIRGFVHIKDALQHLSAVNGSQNGEAKSSARSNGGPVKFLTPMLRQKINAQKLVRKVLFVPPSMPVGDLLSQMQATRVHMAVVVDEYGGTDGLVTIEDLIETVVGDIEDEHDEDDESLIREVDTDTYVAKARAGLEDLQAMIGPDFDPGSHADYADTLGGLLFHLVDRVPVRGEVISRLKGFEFEILSADARRIKTVRITRRKRASRARASATKGSAKPNPAAE